MSTIPHRLQHAPRETPRLPPLRAGDHLPRAEFERRYAAMPGLKKAELLEGVVHMPSPVRHEDHGGPHARILFWVTLYRMHTRGVDVSDNATLRLDARTEPQPDVCLFILPRHGGQARLVDGYLEGAPELVIEVAASSVSMDLHLKRRVYAQAGVREYVVWRVEDGAIDWFSLEGGALAPVAAPADGIFVSAVFPGLRLDAAALLRDDLLRVHAAVLEGVAAPAHAAFVARLAETERQAPPEPPPGEPSLAVP